VPGVDPSLFKAALGRLASGVTVVTVRGADGIDHGMTASAFTSLSLDPPLVLVCVEADNSTYEIIESSDSFAVNILARSQEEISNRFAGGIVGADGRWTPWPMDRDRFEDLDFSRGEHSGAALLEGSLASLDCTLEAVLPGGDHGIFVGRVQGATLCEGAAQGPLLYSSGGYGTFTRSGS
jgi:flavin reductase (DIM6/NTAB) family NADH-FMN oxidoreductase RutF